MTVEQYKTHWRITKVVLIIGLLICLVALIWQVDNYGDVIQSYEERIIELEQQLLDSLNVPEPQTCGYIDDALITFYCTEQYPHVCNDGAPYLTRTETHPTPGRTCAVDPRLIPLGSEVTILYSDGTHQTLIAEDTGGSLKANSIDVVVESHEDALRRGVAKAIRVYWREPTDESSVS